MDDGIFEIKLLPAWSPSNIQAVLKSALSRSQFLQAGIAYWTVNDQIFGSSLLRALGEDNGFLCVDLHPPTDIDALAALVRKGAHVYLFCEDITTPDTGRKERPHLLHTKMLLFWLKDQTVELWVGSHNWTTRSIAGLNIESSIVIRARNSSILFADAAQYLQKIKQICNEFDLSKIDFYKQAQQNTKSQRTVPVIYLEAKNAGALDNLTFGLFGTDVDDLKELGTVGRDVHASVLDSDSAQEYLYPASILQTGRLSASHPLSFPPSRYAFRPGRKLPVLLPDGEVGRDVLASALYFVTLSLRRVDTSVTAEPVPPKTSAWVDVDPAQSPLLQRLDPDARNLLFGGTSPQSKRPRFETGASPFDAEDSRALTLAERRSLPQTKLVTRRILRRK